jgi:DNA-binding CsgD family transcriptional regulator
MEELGQAIALRSPQKEGRVQPEIALQLEHAFNSVKRACYAGLDSVTLRREIVDRVAGAVPFDAYAFSVCDPDTGIMAHTVAEGIPAALARLYLEVLYPSVADIPADVSRNGRTVFSMADEAPLVQRAFRTYGVKDETHVSISTSGRLWGTWCLMRFASTASGSTSHFPFLERLTPHIARGLQSAALIDHALSGDADDSSTQTAPGVLVLDSANRATLRTERAATWLADLRDVGVSAPDDIPLSVISLAARLRASGKAGAREEQVRVRGLSGRWYVLRASLSLPGASGENSLVVVIRPAMALEVAAILTRLYGFSVREREVIAALVRGEATKTIAASLGLSPHTVTEHIDRACSKLGVRGRKALIAKLFFQGYAPKLRAVKPTIGQAAG